MRQLLPILLSFAFVGCSGIANKVASVTPASLMPATQSSPVVRIVSLWEPAEGTGLNGGPSRGFAGQILFFTPNNSSPIPVKGTIDIYEFDDMGTAEEQAKPIHKFRFDSGGWNAHLGEGTLGPGYNVFLPYVKKHGYKTTCALRIRFTPADGGSPVYSELSSITLPGAENPERLGATRGSFSGSVQELLQSELGDIGKLSERAAEQEEKRLEGATLRNENKSEDSLRTLTIRPDSRSKRR